MLVPVSADSTKLDEPNICHCRFIWSESKKASTLIHQNSSIRFHVLYVYASTCMVFDFHAHTCSGVNGAVCTEKQACDAKLGGVERRGHSGAPISWRGGEGKCLLGNWLAHPFPLAISPLFPTACVRACWLTPPDASGATEPSLQLSTSWLRSADCQDQEALSSSWEHFYISRTQTHHLGPCATGTKQPQINGNGMVMTGGWGMRAHQRRPLDTVGNMKSMGTPI